MTMPLLPQKPQTEQNIWRNFTHFELSISYKCNHHQIKNEFIAFLVTLRVYSPFPYLNHKSTIWMIKQSLCLSTICELRNQFESQF